MSEHRILYADAFGVRRTSLYDPSVPERLVIRTEQDVEPVLDSIARDRELMRHGYNKVAARLPAIVVENLIKREIYYDDDAFRRWLNSSEADPWRIWPGRV